MVDAPAASLAKQKRCSNMQAENTHFHLSVHLLSCYDKTLKGLRFPGCCVPSLGHMSLLNNRSSERKCERERELKRVKERRGDRNARLCANEYCSWVLCID